MARAPILPDENGEYTEKQIERLKKRAINSAMWHLERAPQTVADIRTKLKKKQIPDDIIQETIERLEDVELLNDRNYAENFVYSKRSNQKLGVNSIRQKLRMKGIDSDTIEEALAVIDEDDLRETAYELAERRVTQAVRSAPDDRRKQVQKIAQFLSYRGYSGSLVFEIAQKVVEEHHNSADDTDY